MVHYTGLITVGGVGFLTFLLVDDIGMSQFATRFALWPALFELQPFGEKFKEFTSNDRVPNFTPFRPKSAVFELQGILRQVH